MFPHPVAVFHHTLDRRAAAFGLRSQRLDGDVEQPAGFVAGTGVRLQRVSAQGGVVAVTSHHREDVSRDLAADGALREEVFRTGELRHFADDAASTGANQQVAGVAEGGVGGEPAEGVAAAAFETQRERG